MAVFKTLPTPAMVTPVKPKGTVEKLLARVAHAMLFPENQPGWRVAGHHKTGFNVRLSGTVSHEDIRLIEPNLILAGWTLEQIKYKAGKTYLVLVDTESAKRDEAYYATRPITSNRSPL